MSPQLTPTRPLRVDLSRTRPAIVRAIALPGAAAESRPEVFCLAWLLPLLAVVAGLLLTIFMPGVFLALVLFLPALLPILVVLCSAFATAELRPTAPASGGR
jgi:hypothetical protein